MLKQGLKKITLGSIRTQIAKVLKAYRLTPHPMTGMSPAEMLLGRCPKLRFDLLKPLTADRIEANQWKQNKGQSSEHCLIKKILSWSRIFKLLANGYLV